MNPSYDDPNDDGLDFRATVSTPADWPQHGLCGFFIAERVWARPVRCWCKTARSQSHIRRVESGGRHTAGSATSSQ
jgi:hypothetical protein